MASGSERPEKPKGAITYDRTGFVLGADGKFYIERPTEGGKSFELFNGETVFPEGEGVPRNWKALKNDDPRLTPEVRGKFKGVQLADGMATGERPAPLATTPPEPSEEPRTADKPDAAPKPKTRTTEPATPERETPPPDQPRRSTKRETRESEGNDAAQQAANVATGGG